MRTNRYIDLDIEGTIYISVIQGKRVLIFAYVVWKESTTLFSRVTPILQKLSRNLLLVICVILHVVTYNPPQFYAKMLVASGRRKGQVEELSGYFGE